MTELLGQDGRALHHRTTAWTAVGSGVHCPAAVARRSSLAVDLFARGSTGELLHSQGDAGGWGEWRSLGLPVGQADGSSAPVGVDWQLAACSGSPDRIELFARSPDGDLLHMRQTGGAWDDGFDVLGSPAAIVRHTAVPMGLASPPAACSTGPGEIDVFALGPDGDVLHTTHDGSGWSGFESLGMPASGRADGQRPAPPSAALAACACGPTRMGVLARGWGGDLLLNWWDGTQWTGFVSLGMPHEEEATLTFAAPLTGPPAACSWGPGRLDVFARGSGGEMLHRCWDGNDWSGWTSLGMPRPGGHGSAGVPFTGAVAACAPATGHLDVFARALDGVLYHARWDGTWAAG